VTDLSTHDQLDLAPRARRMQWSPDWRVDLRRDLLSEFHRPIRVAVGRRLMRAGLFAEVTIDAKKHYSYLGKPPPTYEGPEETSLAWTTPLSVTMPVPIEASRRWA
jgi:hypothetical protein